MRSFMIVLTGLLFLPSPILAAPVGLEQALREAVTARPQVLAARHQAAVARAAAAEAGSRYLPRATLSETFVWTDEPASSLFISLNQEDLRLSDTADAYNFPPSRKNFETRLTVDQPLYDPDVAYGRHRAEKGADAALAAAEWSAEQAAFAAFRSYLEVQRSESALTWSESSCREAEEMVRLADERYAAGTGLKADLLRARVQLSEASQLRTTTKNDLILARRRLALAMGRESGEVAIAGHLQPHQLAGAQNPEVAQRADLKAAAFEAEQAALAWKQSRATYLPRAAFTGSYALHDAGAPFGTDAGSWAVRVGLSWELYDGGRRGHGKQRAVAHLRAAEFEYLDATRQARFQVEEAQLRATEAEENLQTARQSVAEAEESRSLLEDRYKAGLVDLGELLAAQTALDRARFAAVAAESRLILALGNIRLQSGTFLQSLLPREEIMP